MENDLKKEKIISGSLCYTSVTLCWWWWWYSVTKFTSIESAMPSNHLYLIYDLVAKSYLTLCDPMDCSLPGSSVHGIFQTRILEWVAISFSRGSSPPRDWTCVSCIAGRFNNSATREAPCLIYTSVTKRKEKVTCSQKTQWGSVNRPSLPGTAQLSQWWCHIPEPPSLWGNWDCDSP